MDRVIHNSIPFCLLFDWLTVFDWYSLYFSLLTAEKYKKPSRFNKKSTGLSFKTCWTFRLIYLSRPPKSSYFTRQNLVCQQIIFKVYFSKKMRQVQI